MESAQLTDMGGQSMVVLAIVLVNEDDSHEGPYYIRRPFDREPGWGVSSINYNLSDLLQKAESR